jgi:O-antigen/teichoic acid export membrane protein
MSFKRGLAWTIFGQSTFFIVQFVGSVIVARILSPYDFGVYAIAVAFTGLLSLVQSVGLGSYMVREPELTPERIATAFTINAIISFGLAIATASAALAGSLLFDNASVRGVLLVLAISPLIGMLNTVPYALLEREGNFRLISITGMVRSLASTGGTVALAVAGWGFYAIAWGQLGASLIAAVLLCVAARRHVHWKLSLSNWREISRFGMQMVAITGVNTLASRTSDLVLGKVLGLQSLGLYTRAANTNNLFWDNIHTVLGRVAFSEMSKQKREGKSLRGFYLNAVDMMTALLWPLFTGLAVLAHPLIRLVYGSQWVKAADLFALLNLWAVLLVSITLTWEVFVACGETARQARFEFIRTGVGTLLFVVGCSISLKAAAIARVAEAIFSIFLYRPHLERMTDTNLQDAGKVYLRSGLLTALAVGPAVALIRTIQSSSITAFHVALVVAAGVLLWTCGLLVLQHPLMREARAILGRRVLTRARG